MTCPGSSIFGFGGHSVVLWISPGIAAKVALKKGDERLRHEQQVFELLDQSECPQLLQCFFRGIDVTFLELIDNGTLHDRLSFINKPQPVLQWMLQLSSAAACLEAIGYAHGDINPQNILFDTHDQLKLIDFDHSPKVGDDLDVGYEPYVRQHREIQGGLFGVAGPITEQFALGSVFWYMTRGSELYSDLEGPDQVDRLLDGKFPATDPRDAIDRIIGNCWNGYYPRIADLVNDISEISGRQIPTKSTNKHESRQACETYYNRMRSLLPGLEIAK
ncbi:protein kinase domain-containing protein [Fusarium austroafricanum]|uniref:Protein kinase domain-containing protein n=1 Tax=Fusarium austroafricanum TaxID=2364996 RepID=A0A8H4KH32_9HYPO|nr:protein kinase domain-containing protein [Fusarium austroafricanum]